MDDLLRRAAEANAASLAATAAASAGGPSLTELGVRAIATPAAPERPLFNAAFGQTDDVAGTDATIELDRAPAQETIAALNDRVYGYPGSCARTLRWLAGLDASVVLAGGVPVQMWERAAEG